MVPVKALSGFLVAEIPPKTASPATSVTVLRTTDHRRFSYSGLILKLFEEAGGVTQAGLFVVRADHLFHDPGRETVLEGMAYSGGQQRSGLCDRLSHWPVWLHPRQCILHRTLRAKFALLAKIGRALSSSKSLD